LAGGLDIHPLYYKRYLPNDSNIHNTDIKRDMREFFLINQAKKKDIPILGICRGHQLLGISNGIKNRFIPDILNEDAAHSATAAEFEESKMVHEIQIIDQNFLNCEEDFYWINSFHHQAFGYLKNDPLLEKMGIKVIGISPLNDENNIIELMSGKNWISCQWHPEYYTNESQLSRFVLDHFKELIKQYVSK
jgi:putative glutamine amidotransferase